MSAPDNGDIELSGVHPGSNAAYSCEEGYTLVGDDTRKCQRNGQWTGSAPICESKFIITIIPTCRLGIM